MKLRLVKVIWWLAVSSIYIYIHVYMYTVYTVYIYSVCVFESDTVMKMLMLQDRK